MLGRFNPWLEVDGVLPPINSYVDLPPEPEISWEFWKKMGIKIEVAK
jgi:hypothetical protein